MRHPLRPTRTTGTTTTTGARPVAVRSTGTAPFVGTGLLLAAALLVAAAPAHAAVTDVTTTGFEVRYEVALSAPPDSAWRALTHPERWWDSGHTFSGDARNMSLDARAGGLFMEKLPNGGSVTHLTVAFVQPGGTLRLTGAMGPMQGSGLAGSQTWSLKADGAGTKLVLVYSVGGYLKGGFAQMSAACDGMLTGTVGRYQSYVNTGHAAAAK